jgi:hypothetical protein
MVRGLARRFRCVPLGADGTAKLPFAPFAGLLALFVPDFSTAESEAGPREHSDLLALTIQGAPELVLLLGAYLATCGAPLRERAELKSSACSLCTIKPCLSFGRSAWTA